MLALLMLWSILVTLGCAGMAQEPAVAAVTPEPNQEAPVAAVTQEPEPPVAAVTLEPEPERVDALVLIRGGVSYAVDLAGNVRRAAAGTLRSKATWRRTRACCSFSRRSRAFRSG